ncbi:hypothetical protein C0J52_01803 [Blattella germanica]|nr:hypothetical protein C0J52_01803 [Blattella germanica]
MIYHNPKSPCQNSKKKVGRTDGQIDYIKIASLLEYLFSGKSLSVCGNTLKNFIDKLSKLF